MGDTWLGVETSTKTGQKDQGVTVVTKQNGWKVKGWEYFLKELYMYIATSITLHPCTLTRYWYSQYLAMLFLHVVAIRYSLCIYSICHYFYMYFIFIFNSVLLENDSQVSKHSVLIYTKAHDKKNVIWLYATFNFFHNCHGLGAKSFTKNTYWHSKINKSV